MPSSPDAPSRAPFVPGAGATGPGRAARTPLLRLAGGPADERARSHASGWAAGRAEALLVAARAEQHRLAEHEAHVARAAQQAEAARQRALAALTRAAQDRVAEDDELAARVTGLVLDLAADLATAMVGAAAPLERARAAVQRALDAAGDDDTALVVRMHPADVEALGGPAAVPGAELRADAALLPGDAVASRGAARVDARVRDVVGRALAGLAGAGATAGAPT